MRVFSIFVLPTFSYEFAKNAVAIRYDVCPTDRDFFQSEQTETPYKISTNDQLIGMFAPRPEKAKHGVSGKIYRRNEHSIVIDNFNYNDHGKEAYIYVGTKGEPNIQHQSIVLRYPDDGMPYDELDVDDLGLDALPQIRNSTVVLTLPEGRLTSDLQWMSISDRDSGEHFGSSSLKMHAHR